MSLTHKTVQLLLRSRKFPGRDYLIEKLPRWFLPKPSECKEIQTNFGFKIKVYPNTDLNIERPIYERGVYEYGMVEFIKNHLESGNTFVDVGANIGFLSMVASNVVGDSGRVISFEPVPAHCNHFEENIKLNEIHNLEIRQHALGNFEKEKDIYLHEGNKGGASLVIKSDVSASKIRVKRWDDLNIAGPIHMMKIDVEGYEWEVLKGAKKMILSEKPILIVEYSSDRNNEGNSVDMYRWILDLGIYETYRLERGKERPSKLVSIKSKTVGLPVHDNIICLPIN